MPASSTINLFCPMQCLWNAFIVLVYLYVPIGTFSSMTDGVPIVTYARSPEKRTVGFSVHHNGRSAVSVGARGSDNIVESSSDSRSGGREGTSGGGESGGGCQKSCKTKESHCTQWIYYARFNLWENLVSPRREVFRGRGYTETPLEKERDAENLKRANDDRSREHKRLE